MPLISLVEVSIEKPDAPKFRPMNGLEFLSVEASGSTDMIHISSYVNELYPIGPS